MTTSSHPPIFSLTPEVTREYVIRMATTYTRQAIGTVSQDQIVGKALLIVWPLTNFGGVH